MQSRIFPFRTVFNFFTFVFYRSDSAVEIATVIYVSSALWYEHVLHGIPHVHKHENLFYFEKGSVVVLP